MSVPTPNISDLVDITDTHGDMIPRAGIDYYTSKGYSDLGLTQNYHTSYTIKKYVECFGTCHYCRPEDVPPTAASTSPIKLEVGKTYLTKAGYIIPIVHKSNGYYLSTIECSPGITRNSKRTIQQFLSDCGRSDDDKKFGWMWENNGEIYLDPEWSDKLQIVKELR